MKEKIIKVLKKMSLHAVKVSCNTASYNFSGQPKEPESLNSPLGIIISLEGCVVSDNVPSCIYKGIS